MHQRNFGRWILILSLGAAGACAPYDEYEGDIESGEIAEEEIQFAGTLTALHNVERDQCATRVGSGVRPRRCGQANQSWDAYQLRDGSYALCVPGTYRSYSETTSYGGVCIPPSWEEQPFQPGRTATGTCHGTVTVTTTGARATCMVRYIRNEVQMQQTTLAARTDWRRYGGQIESSEATGHWTYEAPYVRWAGSHGRRLTVVGDGVGLHNDNGTTSQHWNLR